MNVMDENINIENKEIQVTNIKFQKMLLIYNALEEGWTVHKKKSAYIFCKKHEGKKEILLDSYLTQFMKSNFDINKLLS